MVNQIYIECDCERWKWNWNGSMWIGSKSHPDTNEIASGKTKRISFVIEMKRIAKKKQTKYNKKHIILFIKT